MKKIYFLLATAFLYLPLQSQTFTWSPEFFSETDDPVTLTVSGFDPNSAWNESDIYLWSWHIDEAGVQINNPEATGTNFGNSPESARFANNGDGTYTYDFGRPTDFFNNTGIATIGFLIKSQDGTNQSSDFFKDVGVVEVNLTSPSSNFVLLNSGDNLTISGVIQFQGTNTNMGTLEVYLNNAATPTQTVTCGSPNCTATLTNITEDTAVRVVGIPPAPNNSLSGEALFNIKVVAPVIEETLPAGMVEGINYNPLDFTRATLVLDAPFKDLVEVAGSFNNYQPTADYVMKKDATPGSTKFWLELTNLTPGEIYNYQYWVFDTNPVANSPELVKTADPYSTLVLSPFDDPFIPAQTYPNLPVYPVGQEREVTVLQTGQTPYPWQVTNFEKPKKEDLIIYEVLVRDFDSNSNYQDLIDRIDYFKNLNINAIQLMPVMEFEGNESWGYNTSFHMALDKFYGTEDKFKEFVDVCHQNGIAVILDIALNHAFGRNPLVRMWMDDPDGDGWGGPSTENPYFNVTPQHSFNVGSDFSHTEEQPNTPAASSNDDTNPITNHYVERVVKHWIEEFKIDGFRWDLTKGFTQNCSGGNDSCTNAYQQDRVDILKEYADYSWSLDDDHYVIFEHLGTDNEEQEWANYREAEGKGIMLWGKMTEPYNELTMGQNGNKNINRMGHLSRGFTKPRLIGYPESHDEERLMYNNITNGKNFGGYNITDLDTALGRMSALGAVSALIPGPKMIWHFGDLGMEMSIFTCTNGTINLPNTGAPGDCKLDTKPQPQWPWLETTNPTSTDILRNQIYNDWARLHELKINEPVFEGDYTINSGSFTPRIDIFDTSIPTTELRNVIVLANFDVVTQDVAANFPDGVSETWYDLMDPSGNITFPRRTGLITLAPGEFKVIGNRPANILSLDENTIETFTIYPNPTTSSFKINLDVSELIIYDITGKLVKSFNGSFSQNDEFDISTIKSGIYLVNIKNNNNQTQTTKLIKL